MPRRNKKRRPGKVEKPGVFGGTTFEERERDRRERAAIGLSYVGQREINKRLAEVESEMRGTKKPKEKPPRKKTPRKTALSAASGVVFQSQSSLKGN